eukprot:TRINITY_DN4253_c0_g1_i1.p1 TRINITY_DN4253_c0_g1~~TRINITY_DN4253_c0_g1_i1.p1  ORF type:complete len:349 (+),score=44.06 TRINITY_DN4253_c0_g1_i1:302-1348(+)
MSLAEPGSVSSSGSAMTPVVTRSTRAASPSTTKKTPTVSLRLSDYNKKKGSFVTSRQLAKRMLFIGVLPGIGYDVIRHYAKNHQILGILGPDGDDSLTNLAEECRKLGASEAFCIDTDVTSKESVDGAVDQFIGLLEGIDLVFYFSTQLMQARLTELQPFEFRELATQVMNLNYRGAVFAIHTLLEHLLESKGQLVTVMYGIGNLNPPGMSFYSASIAALEVFVDAVQKENPVLDTCLVKCSNVNDESFRTRLGPDLKAVSGEEGDPTKGCPLTDITRQIVSAVLARKRIYTMAMTGEVWKGQVSSETKKGEDAIMRFNAADAQTKPPCQAYLKSGKCARGTSCPFAH